MKNHNIPKPEGAQWTDDQWRAITESGKDLLVAAAAGSGKTAVLVQRIIEKVINPEYGIDVDRLLVVTFTKAAALEMKQRLQEALEKALKSDPSSNHLRKQLHVINRAQISTIHSFCLQIISSYAYLLEIDPGFRLGDEKEVELLLDEVIEQVLEEEYAKGDSDGFLQMVDRFTSDRNDDDIVTIVRKLLKAAYAHPFPKEWLKNLTKHYDVNNETIEESIYVKEVRQIFDQRLQGYIEELTYYKSLTLLPSAPYMYADTIEKDIVALQKLREENQISFMRGFDYVKQTNIFGKMAQCRDKTVSDDLKERVKNGRDDVKKQYQAFHDQIYKKGIEGLVRDFTYAREVIEILTATVEKVMDTFTKLKAERSIVDFTDLEHMALKILLNPEAENLAIEPSGVAKSYQDYFEEVYIDEFQDINYVQEAILSLVSRSNGTDGNRFMVGDVKQSIYRFRLAEPKLFISKYETFARDESQGIKIDLSQNFRSREEILFITNFLFRQIMGKEVGEIDYDDDASLKVGATYYPEATERQSEFVIISKDKESIQSDSEEEEELEDIENAVIEARYIAKEIHHLIETGYTIYDKGLKVMRPMRYSDITILVRSMPWAPQMVEELKSHGVPVYAELSAGYFDAIEIKIMISLLQIIDNPHQDIPLASVLRSPIVGLSENELTQIRVANPKGDYFDGLLSYLENGERNSTHLSNAYEKVKVFYDHLKTWREKHHFTPLHSLIWDIYQESGYYDFLGAMSGGKQRQANLEVFYERARQFEKGSQRGIYRFLRYIDRLLERGDDFGAAHAVGEKDDVVRIMTIHKSKGLEFPIVFLANLGKNFNVRDMQEKVLLHKNLGMALKYYDLEKRITYQTLPQLTIKETIRKEMLAEEMRVLYVALTRAKEKLYMVGTVKNADKLLKSWSVARGYDSSLLPSYIVRKAKGFIDWLGYSLTRHDSMDKVFEESGIEVEKIKSDFVQPALQVSVVDAYKLQIEKEEEETEKIRAERLGHIRFKRALQEFMETSEYEQLLEWEYKHKDATLHEVKQSVTELKRRQQVETPEQVYQTGKTGGLEKLEHRPLFYQEKTMTAAEKGTATHFVMQHIPLDRVYSFDELNNLLLEMIRKELLTEEEYEVIDIPRIAQFYETPLFTMMKNSKRIYREMPFTLSIPSSKMYADWEDEEESVLVQGMIDCLFEFDGKWVLLDFKTDTISGKYKQTGNELNEVLQEKYTEQMKWYKYALEKITNEEIYETYLYYFDGGHIIKM